jgi:hypothetical protein
MASQANLIGGNFQDGAGNTLSNGWITLTLSQDSNISANDIQVVAGRPVTFRLDASGNLLSVQNIWTTDVLAPSGSYYSVVAFNNAGLQVWAYPQTWTLTYSATINVGTIQPNTP